MTKEKFVTPFNYVSGSGTVFSEPSLTEQTYKDECDINFIISNYVRTGQLPEQTASYQDLTTVQDYQEAQYLLAECKSNFYALPSRERDRFQTVENYLSFISDPKNLKESYEKGYIDRSSVDVRDVYPERYVVREDVSVVGTPQQGLDTQTPVSGEKEGATTSE